MRKKIKKNNNFLPYLWLDSYTNATQVWHCHCNSCHISPNRINHRWRWHIYVFIAS